MSQEVRKLVSASCSFVPDSVTSWTAAHQAPLSMAFSRQGYWSGLPFPSPGDLSNPGIEPGSPALQADSLLTELQGKKSGPQFHFKIEETRASVESLTPDLGQTK